MCEICNDTGVIYSNESEPGQPSDLIQCDCQKKLFHQIPPKFQNSTFENFRKVKAEIIFPEQRKIFLPDFIQNNSEKNFFICGNFSQGKTHLLYSQAKKLISEKKKVFIYRESDLLNDLQKSAYDEQNDKINLNHHIKNKSHKHFFIDDLGKTPVTEDRLFQLYNFIDIVYNCEYGLTITTNFKASEIEKRWKSNYAGSIISRLKSMCYWIYIFSQ
jgi:DNA replication protein DnaC